MTRTPDDIKKGLECCVDGFSCRTTCPYTMPFFNIEKCTQMMAADALSLIQQLEAQNAELLKKVEQLQAERDAAVRDMTEIVQNSGDSYCEYCINWKPGTCPPYCRTHSEGFRWRGVQKEK